MIDTESLYGSIGDEYAVKQAYKHTDEHRSVPLADETALPDFPEQFDPGTALTTMFKMQIALQNILAKKRGTLAPTNNADNHENAKRSGYFMMSTVTEIFEFFEQLEKDNFEVTDLVKYEIIDAWHFVMNQLIYMKYTPSMTLGEYFEKSRDDLKTGTLCGADLHYLVGEFIESVGDLYQNASSYKDWKTYSEWKEDPIKIQELGDKMLIKFIKIFVVIGMSPETVYKFYYDKNIENVNRQKAGGRYEK